jgi:hypothetical protein
MTLPSVETIQTSGVCFNITEHNMIVHILLRYHVTKSFYIQY